MSLRVRILGSSDAQLCVASSDRAERLLDLLDEHEVRVRWLSCRSARCGACLLSVLEDTGGALLPAGEDEAEGLAGLAAERNLRLGCQLTVRAGASGQLVLRPQREKA